MKKLSWKKSFTPLLPTAVIILFAGSMMELPAQRQVGLPVEIADVEINTVTTPSYGDRTHSRARRPSDDWIQILARVRLGGSQDDWLDSMSISWHVMIDGGQTPFLYFQTDTEYIDVQGGEDHYAAVYLRPDAVKRHYGSRRLPGSRNIVVHIQVSADGAPRADLTYNPARMRIPDQWWESPRMNRIAGGLLAPDRTPFQWLDYDFYLTLNPDR